VWNLVSQRNRRALIEGKREQGAEENIWAPNKRSDMVEETLHNEDLYNLYFSAHIISINRSRKTGWVKHAACI
jgi:hypothetical protein